MKEDLKKLLALQDIDLEALRLREQLILYTPMLKQIEKNMARNHQEHQELVSRRKDLHKLRRDLEKEIEFKQDQINKKLLQQMIHKIKQDAYDALKHEIDRLKEEIGQMEDKILEFISSDEELEKTIALAEKRLKLEEEEAEAERQRIAEQVKSKKDRLARLDKEREEQLKSVPPHLLSYYNRFYKSYGPFVLAFVEGDSCGGCHFRILSQVMVEIHKGDMIVYCEGCRRILMTHD
jgi:hypothetical protein